MHERTQRWHLAFCSDDNLATHRLTNRSKESQARLRAGTKLDTGRTSVDHDDSRCGHVLATQIRSSLVDVPSNAQVEGVCGSLPIARLDFVLVLLIAYTEARQGGTFATARSFVRPAWTAFATAAWTRLSSETSSNPAGCMNCRRYLERTGYSTRMLRTTPTAETPWRHPCAMSRL